MFAGFVDIQFNGWMGTSFTAKNLTPENVLSVTRDMIAKGTIAYCPTVITGAEEDYRTNFAAIATAMKDPELGRHILGIHLEGPFISPVDGARGAHALKHVRTPDCDTLDRFQEWADGAIRVLTVAPEVDGAMELIRHAVKRGIAISIGHHNADDQTMQRAVDAGASLITHLGNGIPNMIHRHENPLWWQLACDQLSALCITDGQHLPADLIAVAVRAKGVERFIVISDAAPIGGMPPGEYAIFDDLPVVIEPSGRISSATTQTLAGSHSCMFECMNHLASLNLLSEDELWQVGCVNPLKAIGKSVADIAGLIGPTMTYNGQQFVLES